MKRFVFLALLFVLPVALMLAATELLVDWDSIGGDLGRMARLEFPYTRPPEDSVTPRGSCTDLLPTQLADTFCSGLMVFGDSFSEVHPDYWQAGRWHQFAAAVLGTDVVHVITRRHPVEVYLALLQHHPDWLADTVVVESVERSFLSRLGKVPRGGVAEEVLSREPENIPNPNAMHMRLPDYWKKRLLGGSTGVSSRRLVRPLFDCRADTMFFLGDDEWSRYNNSSATDTALARMRWIDSLSLARGKHLFWVVIPDKLTVYEPYLLEPVGVPSFLDDTVVPGLITPLHRLRQLVGQGVKEVYYCDDTHFSSLAARETGLIVGHAIADGATCR